MRHHQSCAHPRHRPHCDLRKVPFLEGMIFAFTKDLSQSLGVTSTNCNRMKFLDTEVKRSYVALDVKPMTTVPLSFLSAFFTRRTQFKLLHLVVSCLARAAYTKYPFQS